MSNHSDKPPFPPEGDLFVLLAERDTYKPEDGGRPIVFEQYIDGGAASLENVKRFQERLGDKYGKTRIARLQLIDDDIADAMLDAREK